MEINTPYRDIYDCFLTYISDYIQVNKTDVEFEQFCYNTMKVSIPKVRKLEHSFYEKDDDLKEFSNTLLDVEIAILALQMVSDWINPQLYNTLLVKQYIGTGEDKFFAQANQINALRNLKSDARIESSKLRRNYKYQNNSYFTK